MNRDHDLLHQALAEAEGLEYSPALRYSIDGPPPRGVIPREERAVFLVQRLVAQLRTLGCGDDAVFGLVGARRAG